MEPGGLWDADRFEVRAIWKRNGSPGGEFDMLFTGEVSRFEGELEADEPGSYEVTVYAYDPANGNTGVDRVTFRVSQ